MRKDRAVIIHFQDCAQQENERRKIVFKSAARLLQQGSRELVLACLACTLIVLAAVLLVTVAVALLESSDVVPVSLPQYGEYLPPRRLSFVSLGEDCDVSPRCRCAVAAAARLNPRLPCHVYNILEAPSIPGQAGLALLPNVQVHYNTSSRYFSDSPLDDWWRLAPRDLATFAARVLALWRHGGTSVDARLVALEGADVGKLADKSVLLEAEQGRVMSAPAPCHAFLFELMRALRRESGNTAVRDVINNTLRQFCLSGRDACPGVDIMPQDMFCGLEDASNITSPEVETPNPRMRQGESGELDANAIVVVGMSDYKNYSFSAAVAGVPFKGAAHVPRRKRQTCTWVTMDNELQELMCPLLGS